MQTEKIALESAKNAFNTIKVLKGQYANIATCDEAGNPNVAPIGSMRIVDDETVHVLQGFLPRTMQNLRRNPKATFSVNLRPRVMDFLSVLRNKEDESMGYQVTCELMATDASTEAVVEEYRHIARRTPWLLRGAFMRFCEKNLKQLLKFKITEVRSIGKP